MSQLRRIFCAIDKKGWPIFQRIRRFSGKFLFPESAKILNSILHEIYMGSGNEYMYTEELKSCNLRFPLISAEKKSGTEGFFYVSNEMVGNEFVY